MAPPHPYGEGGGWRHRTPKWGGNGANAPPLREGVGSGAAPCGIGRALDTGSERRRSRWGSAPQVPVPVPMPVPMPMPVPVVPAPLLEPVVGEAIQTV